MLDSGIKMLLKKKGAKTTASSLDSKRRQLQTGILDAYIPDKDSLSLKSPRLQT